MSTDFYVYLLISTKGATYVGATVNVEHRLRQHNKELVGGARATSAKVMKGETWTIACYVSNFPTWQSALQFEWRWKQLTRKSVQIGPPIVRRINALNQLCSLKSSTTNAIPFAEWPNEPLIIFNSVDAHNCYTAQFPYEIQTTSSSTSI